MFYPGKIFQTKFRTINKACQHLHILVEDRPNKNLEQFNRTTASVIHRKGFEITIPLVESNTNRFFGKELYPSEFQDQMHNLRGSFGSGFYRSGRGFSPSQRSGSHMAAAIHGNNS